MRRAPLASVVSAAHVLHAMVLKGADAPQSSWCADGESFPNQARRSMLRRKMTRLTLRIIGKALLSVDFASKADSISKAITTMLEYLKQLTFSAPSNAITPSHYRLFQEAKTKTTIDALVYGIIEGRRKGEKRHDLLALLLGEENGGETPLSVLAMMEGTLILATIAQRYSLRLEPGQRVERPGPRAR